MRSVTWKLANATREAEERQENLDERISQLKKAEYENTDLKKKLERF